MLSRVNRLPSTRDFVKVKQQGKVYQFDSFGLVFRERGDTLPSRFGFVVSNRISKKATLRNKIKRELREAVKKLTFKLKDGYDVIFLAKQRLVSKGKQAIENEVGDAFKESGIMK